MRYCRLQHSSPLATDELESLLEELGSGAIAEELLLLVDAIDDLVEQDRVGLQLLHDLLQH